MRRLFNERNDNVLGAMSELADIAQKGRDALAAGRISELPALVNANFDLRESIFDISPENRRMVSVARSTGASAKFAGSGGAIVGIYEDDAQYERLSAALAEIGCRTFKPHVAHADDEACDAGGGNWRNS